LKKQKESNSEVHGGLLKDMSKKTGSLCACLLSNKEKALKVIRARKMIQVFGSEPPPELYQIPQKRPPDQRLYQQDILAITFQPFNEPDMLTKALPSAKAKVLHCHFWPPYALKGSVGISY
jgi:hypothetical protein